jgi:uncharacterized Fe-S cluster-containing MiaB family protein
MGTLHEDHYTFSITPRSFLLGMKNISDKCAVKFETYFMFSNFFFSENRAVYEIMWNL